MPFLKEHYDTEGPFGIPMTDKQAKSLDELMKTVSVEEPYRQIVVEKATTELGERSDVSWISTEAIDREKEIVRASGFRDDHFKNNPIVTLGHNYDMPPIGKSIWRRRMRDGDTRGIKAKTVYPARPENWPEKDWVPDSAFALVKAGLMTGKSIGFFVLKAHSPTDEEVKDVPDLAKVWRIIDEWMMLEYACTWLPMNQEALVEEVSKGKLELPKSVQKAFNIEIPQPKPKPTPSPIIPYTPLAEIERAIQRGVGRLNLDQLLSQAVKDGWHKARGGV